MDFERLIQGLVEKTNCKSKKTSAEDEETEYTLTFDMEEERQQNVVIYPFEEGEMNMIRVITYIGNKKEFSSNQLISLLEMNPSLKFGAFAIYQGQVGIIDTVHCESALDADKVLESIQYIIKMADTYENMMFGMDRK